MNELVQRHVLTYIRTQWDVCVDEPCRRSDFHPCWSSSCANVLMSYEEVSDEQMITSLTLHLWAVTFLLLDFCCCNFLILLKGDLESYHSMTGSGI